MANSSVTFGLESGSRNLVPSLGITAMTWIATYFAAQSMMEDSTFTVVEDKRNSVPSSLEMAVVLLVVGDLLPFSYMGDRRGMVHHIEAVVPYLAKPPNHRITVSDDYHRTGDSLVGKLQVGIVRLATKETEERLLIYYLSPNLLMRDLDPFELCTQVARQSPSSFA